MTSEERVKHWSCLLAEHSSSGENIAHFCRQRDIAAWKFHYWKKRIKSNESNREESFVELSLSNPSPSNSGIHLVAGHYEIHLQSNFDEQMLKRLLRVL